MSDITTRQNLLGKKVIITVHNLHTGDVYRINATINQQGEIYNTDTGNRIYPLAPGVADELGNIILYDQDKTDTVVETTVKAIEILRKHPEYTIKIATVVDNEDATNEEVRNILIDILKNPIKLVNTPMMRELEAVVAELEEEIKNREEEEVEDEVEDEDTVDNQDEVVEDVTEKVEVETTTTGITTTVKPNPPTVTLDSSNQEPEVITDITVQNGTTTYNPPTSSTLQQVDTEEETDTTTPSSPVETTVDEQTTTSDTNSQNTSNNQRSEDEEDLF